MKKIKKELKQLRMMSFLKLIIAGIINSIGVTLFLAPVNLYDSGISGTSMLLDFITPEYLTLSIFLVVLNVPLFLYGLKKQGLTFTIYAIFSVAIYSVSAFIINDVLPIDVSTSSPLAANDLLLCAIFGGCISGLGSGLAIRWGGAMDGIEVMAIIFAKKLGITVGTFVMIYNVILYVICGLINSGAWTIPLYSIITYFVGLKTIDFVVEGIDRSKAAFIITSRYDDVCAVLSDVLGHGLTLIDAKGYYSDADKKIIYVVLNRFQITRVKELVKRVDPSAYVTINEVADVFKANHEK